MSEVVASAVTIGSFDGVHRGHQAVIAHLRDCAEVLGVEPVVVTFDPLPREFLHGADAPPRIQTVDDRFVALAAAGIRNVACMDFDDALAALDARGFVEEILVRWLHVQAVIVGDDFRFGYQRSGDLEILRALGNEHGFTVASSPTLEADGERISSTRIRTALAAGDIATAAALIGRPYVVSGAVMRGNALGRKLGFPTANLIPGVQLALAEGSYAARVRIGDVDEWRPAAVYWANDTLEAHLLSFSGDLYGVRLQVEFERFVRAHEKMTDLKRLRDAIAADVDEIAAHGRRSHNP
ncbi:MAG: riboflavin biosynthesis protein RibF [Gammaproteobacteria bacterium]